MPTNLALDDRLVEAALEADYARAAECFNACRARGVQGSNADVLLCAVAKRLE